jgi:hypothetical protein
VTHRTHEPSTLRLMVSREPCGCRGSCSGLHLRFSTPLTPGWSFVANCPAEVARGIEAAWTEATIAAYARLRGVLYDLAETEEVIPPEAYATTRPHPAETPGPEDEVEHRRRTKHPATHDPARWVELSDGGMISPRGRRYGPQTRVASAVRARLDRAALP